MSRRLKRRGPGGRTRLDSTVGSRPMIQGRDSEPSPVARIPRVAVESGGRGVAGQTHVRRWPRTTRCNELAVIVMRDGEPVCREPLIAAVPRPPRRLRHGQSAWEICNRFRLKRVLEVGRDVWGRAQTVWARAAAESLAASWDLMPCPATRSVVALSCRPCMIPREAARGNPARAAGELYWPAAPGCW